MARNTAPKPKGKPKQDPDKVYDSTEEESEEEQKDDGNDEEYEVNSEEESKEEDILVYDEYVDTGGRSRKPTLRNQAKSPATSTNSKPKMASSKKKEPTVAKQSSSTKKRVNNDNTPTTKKKKSKNNSDNNSEYDNNLVDKEFDGSTIDATTNYKINKFTLKDDCLLMKTCMTVNPIFKQHKKIMDAWKKVASILTANKHRNSKLPLNHVQVKNRVNILLNHHNNGIMTHKLTNDNKEYIDTLHEQLCAYMGMLRYKEEMKFSKGFQNFRNTMATNNDDDNDIVEVIEYTGHLKTPPNNNKISTPTTGAGTEVAEKNLVDVVKLEIQASQQVLKLTGDNVASVIENVLHTVASQRKMMEEQHAALLCAMEEVHQWDKRFFDLYETVQKWDKQFAEYFGNLKNTGGAIQAVTTTTTTAKNEEEEEDSESESEEDSSEASGGEEQEEVTNDKVGEKNTTQVIDLDNCLGEINMEQKESEEVKQEDKN